MRLRGTIMGLALAISLLASGCASRQRTAAAAAVLGVELSVFAVGGYLFVDSIPDDPDQGQFGAVLVVGSTAAALLTLWLWAMASSGSARPELPPGARAPSDARERAWNLTKQAMEAARADVCSLVVRHAATVKELDAELYAMVFVQDAAIARCLAAPAAP